ncbi:Uncharacterised protein [Oligella urethralis]|nr:Uncharacterised protein [Oligella urethralis]
MYMKKIFSMLAASLMLAGCASHKPAPMPTGTPFPINPEPSQAVMTEAVESVILNKTPTKESD